MGGGTVRLVWMDARLGLYGRRHGQACMGGGTVRLVWAEARQACMGGGTVMLVWEEVRLGLYGRRHGEACMGGVTVRLVWASPCLSATHISLVRYHILSQVSGKPFCYSLHCSICFVNVLIISHIRLTRIGETR